VRFDETGGPAGALLRWQFRLVHRLLDTAVDQLADAAHDRYAACACFARAVLCEDLSVNGVLAVRQPLALSSWAGRTGMSELPPLAGPADWRAWERSVRLDLGRLRPYARAVYASTDAYLAALSEDGLEPVGGETPGCLLSALLLTLAAWHGEIAGRGCPRPG
jgi:hypothetical protein